MTETQKAPVGIVANGGVRPIPDPTVLTTQQLNREISGLREVLEALVNGQKDVFEARLNGMDKAIRLLQDIADRMPGEIEAKVVLRLAVLEEKFNSVQTQFAERDTRAITQRESDKTAVDAALQAQKEAAGKSENSVGKQIDEQGKRVEDLKERVGAIEGARIGGADATTTRQAAGSYNIAILSVMLSVIGAIVVILAFARPGG